EETLRDAFLGADAALSSATTDIDAELQRIAERLQGLRDAVAPKLLKRYDRLRTNHVVAAASLAGSRCDGCHLDLSAAEVDEVRATAASADGVAECPQCGRLLVV
ncbi:MAG: C4-type zinc ribbon domain-containing protein, partial [Acidimicrobiia bacterium]